MTSITPEEFASTQFDYVIIGGGAAGLVLAGRLTEDENVTVGVLEAGLDRSKNPLVMIPGLGLGLAGNAELDWEFRTEPQKDSFDRKVIWPRGKGLGGSSMMNTMMFSNCSKRDLDSWELLGNKGWNWDKMQPYYRKFETYNEPPQALGEAMGSSYIKPKLRGTNGPIQTSFCESNNGWLEQTFIETCKNAGYPTPHDPREGTNLGSYCQLMTIDPKTKTRSYSYTGYLEPNLGRPNLKVLTNAKAGKILLDKDGDAAVATGVEFFVDGIAHTVAAKREVICCAGSIQTPQILELSGIGDRVLLEKHGIKVKVDNPYVGTNLQDHPLVGVSYQVNDDVPTGEMMRRTPELGAKAMDAYQKAGQGPLTSGLTGIGFASLHTVCPDLSDAEVNQLIDKAGQFQSTATRKQLKIQEEQLRDPQEAMVQWLPLAAGANMSVADKSVASMFGHDEPGGFATLCAITTHLFSRGTVHITSSDPIAHPAIDPNYMSHPLDAEIMGRAMLHARQLLRTEPFASKFKKDKNGNLIPLNLFAGPYNDPKTVDEAKEFIKHNFITCYHPIGTASMLPRDEGGVVDTELKVYGTKNLRVIDASIFPLHIQGNIMSLVYAVAERGADMIKGKA